MTYHGIIMMITSTLNLILSRTWASIDLHEQTQKLTVLLVRTGDDSNLCAPINFEELRTDGFRLPLARSDVSATRDDVVRVSLATAFKVGAWPIPWSTSCRSWFPIPRDIIPISRLNLYPYARQTPPSVLSRNALVEAHMRLAS